MGHAIRTLALGCALVLMSTVARAQLPASASGSAPLLSPSPDLPTSRHPDILRLMSEGHELYDAGRYKEAAASFEQAMQLGVERPHEAAWNVAQSYAKLGNRKQAVRWAEIAELLDAKGRHRSRESRNESPASRAQGRTT
jgi:tetratricopeptide (TPR) repeat protein